MTDPTRAATASIPTPDAPANTACARCGAPFRCGAVAGADACWCATLPHIDPRDDIDGCLCPACLDAEIAARSAASSKP